MSTGRLRAWWAHRLGLDGSLAGSPPAAVLERCGWARSAGGAGPYLTLFSRAGTTRAEADAAVAALQIHELPSARGCTYVLPARDFQLALTLATSCGDGDMKVARKLGVTDQEIDKLSDKIIAALERGPLDPEQIREAAAGAARSLGPEGKKKGLTTTLPLALGKLQNAGEIRRLPANGRLDQQRYSYTLWRPKPELPVADAETRLARLYFSWIGPATLAEFQWFSGLGVKAAKAAVEPLGLAPAGDRLLLPEDRDAYEAFRPPAEPHYVLASSLDGLNQHRRNLADLLEPADAERIDRLNVAAKPISSVLDLPDHAIFDRGRLIGLWQYDTATASIAWVSFVKPDAALKQAVARTEEYLRTQLGDARSFSLDSPASRAPRIEALRKA